MLFQISKYEVNYAITFIGVIQNYHQATEAVQDIQL